MNKIIEEVRKFNERNRAGLYSFSILGNGICENWENGPQPRCHNSYSVAKAFTTTLVGMAYDEGYLRPEDKLSKFLGKYYPADIDKRWYDTTIDNAETHRIGLSEGFLDIDGLDSRTFGNDYLNYMLKAKMVCDPGTEWIYTDGTFYLLGRVVEECFKPTNLTQFLWDKLFTPLEFQEFAWSQCPQGHILGGSDLYISSEDMVKLGEVYRNGGVYNGKRIVSKEWTEIVLSRPYELGFNPRWNIHAKGGYGGQMLAVFPEKKLSVAWHGFSDKDFQGELFDIVFNNA